MSNHARSASFVDGANCLRFRDTLHSNFSTAVQQAASGHFYTKRLCKLSKLIADAEEQYAQSVCFELFIVHPDAHLLDFGV